MQPLILLYRKFLKQSEIVYNELEIKNDMTKERRGLRHDVVYEVFCFGLGELHYLTMEKELLWAWSYPYPITFRYCSNSAVFLW